MIQNNQTETQIFPTPLCKRAERRIILRILLSFFVSFHAESLRDDCEIMGSFQANQLHWGHNTKLYTPCHRHTTRWTRCFYDRSHHNTSRLLDFGFAKEKSHSHLWSRKIDWDLRFRGRRLVCLYKRLAVLFRRVIIFYAYNPPKKMSATSRRRLSPQQSWMEDAGCSCQTVNSSSCYFHSLGLLKCFLHWADKRQQTEFYRPFTGHQ